jgi:CubicO group peptidase (beta-lactamase class C family)
MEHTMPRSRSAIIIFIASVTLLNLLTACGAPSQPIEAVLRAQAAPIARAFTPTPSPRPAPLAAARPTARQAPTTTPTPASIVANAAPAAAAATPIGLSQTIDSYINDLVSSELFHGAILVAREGKIILSKGYGLADAERGTPNTAQTRFRLASVTKQFTAAAIMILQARDKLNVQDSICNYLADCPDDWRGVTIQHLLTHTSGIPNYTDFADYDATQMQPATPDQLVARFRNQPLIFAPGTTYSYENSDYVLLGRIIERASGQPYADFLHDAIFDPLQMRDSGVDNGRGGAPDHAVGYSSFADKAPPLDTSTLYSAGALYSTAEDMYRWDQALYTDQLLPQALRNQMFTPLLENYAYGWKVAHLGDHLQIAHPGLIDGFATYIARYPDDHVTVIVLSNMDSADAVGIGSYLASLVLGS